MMKLRLYSIAFLLSLGMAIPSRASNTSNSNPCPLLSHSDPDLEREFKNVCDTAKNIPNGKFSSSSMTLQGLTVDSITVNSSFNLLPSGLIMAYGGSSAPSGYLLCDGSAVSRTTYASLFTAISTTYGSGDGSTTFNLPNLQGSFPVGKNGGTFSALGGTGGAENHQHAIGYLTGSSSFPGVWANTNSPDNQIGGAWSLSGSDNFNFGASAYIPSVYGAASGSYTWSTRNGSSLPPYLVINFIIKT